MDLTNLDEITMREYVPEIGDEVLINVFGGVTLQVIHDDNGVHCHQIGAGFKRIEPKVSLKHKIQKWAASTLDSLSARIHRHLEEQG